MCPSGRVCLGGCMYTYTCAYVWRPDSTMVAIPQLLSVYFLELSLQLKACRGVQAGWPGSPRIHTSLFPIVLGLIVYGATPKYFYAASRDLIGLYAWSASTLPTEISLKVPHQFLSLMTLSEFIFRNYLIKQASFIVYGEKCGQSLIFMFSKAYFFIYFIVPIYQKYI